MKKGTGTATHSGLTGAKTQGLAEPVPFFITAVQARGRRKGPVDVPVVSWKTFEAVTFTVTPPKNGFPAANSFQSTFDRGVQESQRWSMRWSWRELPSGSEARWPSMVST
jgi:hypothetical protein